MTAKKNYLLCFGWLFVNLLCVGSMNVIMSVGQAAEKLSATQLDWSDLKKKEELNVSISIEAKRRNLDDLIREVEQQTGVQISLSPELLQAKKLITVRIDNMRLYDFMAALARTYIANWHYIGNKHYELNLQTSDEETSILSRIGTPLFFRYREKTKTGWLEKQQRRNALYDQIVNEIGKDNLNQPQGISVSLLSGETLVLLRREYEQTYALRLLGRTHEYAPVLSPHIILRVNASEKEVPFRWEEKKLPEGFAPPEFPMMVQFTLEILDEKKNSLTTTPKPLKWTLSENALANNPK